MIRPVSCSSGPVSFVATSNPAVTTAVLPFVCPDFPSQIARTFFNGNYTVAFTKTVNQDTITIVGSIPAVAGQGNYSFSLVISVGSLVGPYPQCLTASATSMSPVFSPGPPGIALVPNGCAATQPNYTGPYSVTVTWRPISNVNLTYTLIFTSSLSSTNPNGALFDTVQGTVSTVTIPQIVLFQAQIDPSDETPPAGMTSVPQIDIIAYSSLNQDNLGEVQFTVRDIISYKCIFLPFEHRKHDCQEQIVKTSEVIETIFVEAPNLNLVVRGKGCTLREKTNYLRVKYGITLSEEEFLGNVIAFGLLKYILARLMYGDFNLKYLLRSFNNQFFRDLEKRRFCLFVNAFIELGLTGYAKFYKCKFREEKFDCCCSNNAIEPCLFKK